MQNPNNFEGDDITKFAEAMKNFWNNSNPSWGNSRHDEKIYGVSSESYYDCNGFYGYFVNSVFGIAEFVSCHVLVA